MKPIALLITIKVWILTGGGGGSWHWWL